MKKWKLKFTKTALEDFNKLPKNISLSVKNKLRWLKNNFDKINHLPLIGELKGLFKLRIGDYRIIYFPDWDKRKIFILTIDHRKDIYKKIKN